MGRIPADGFPFCSNETGSGPPPPQPLISRLLESASPGRGKRPELGANYTSPLVQRLGMSGAVPSLPHCAFVSCKGRVHRYFMTSLCLFVVTVQTSWLCLLLLSLLSVDKTAFRISSVSPVTSSKPPDSLLSNCTTAAVVSTVSKSNLAATDSNWCKI